MDDIAGLSDDHLLMMIDRSARGERERMPDFLACLGELDRRKLAEKRGYSSTFDYCVRRLLLSEDEAYRRIHAARAAVSRPQLLAALAEGQLSLTSVSKIAPHVARADAPEIIARAEGKSTRQIVEMLAPLTPVLEKRDSIRTVAVAATGGAVVQAVKRVEISFRAPPGLWDAIERAKHLLAHKYPFGGLADVLAEIVGDYLERHDPQRTFELGRRGPVRGSSSIAAETRRAVWARDGGRCVFVGPDGTRCESRRMLELDHRIPRSIGGKNTVGNLRLLCRAHNDSERRRLLGEGRLSTDLARAKFGDNSRS